MATAGHDQLDTWFHTHADRFLGYLLRRCPNRAVSEDVLQETFLTALRRHRDVPPEPDVFPWLCGTARRALANHVRSTRRRDALAQRIEAHTTDHVDDLGPAEVELRMSLVVSLRHLSNNDQELLMLVACGGFSVDQIALATCSRAGTVAALGVTAAATATIVMKPVSPTKAMCFRTLDLKARRRPVAHPPARRSPARDDGQLRLPRLTAVDHHGVLHSDGASDGGMCRRWPVHGTKNR